MEIETFFRFLFSRRYRPEINSSLSKMVAEIYSQMRFSNTRPPFILPFSEFFIERSIQIPKEPFLSTVLNMGMRLIFCDILKTTRCVDKINY